MDVGDGERRWNMHVPLSESEGRRTMKTTTLLGQRQQGWANVGMLWAVEKTMGIQMLRM